MKPTPPFQQNQRIRMGALPAALLLAACYVPDHTLHASLTVASDGSLALNGMPTTAEQLPAALASATAIAGAGSTGRLVVEVQASPAAQMPAVQRAVQAVKQSGAQVAFSAATATR